MANGQIGRGRDACAACCVLAAYLAGTEDMDQHHVRGELGSRGELSAA